MNIVKLEKKIRFTAEIMIETGLHIGGSAQGLEIGGVDNPIIRDASTNQPYIPGSSFKGKIRSLLEKSLGITDDKNKFTKLGLCVDPTEKIAKLFGLPADEVSEKAEVASGRLIVRDAFLTDESERKLFTSKFTDAPYTEVKTEVSIDRITSAATPRPLERVPRGAKFEMEMIINILEDDLSIEKELIQIIEEGLNLLEDDYLGGSGTRGSGKVKITNRKKQVKTAKDYKELKNEWQDYK